VLLSFTHTNTVAHNGFNPPKRAFDKLGVIASENLLDEIGFVEHYHTVVAQENVDDISVFPDQARKEIQRVLISKSCGTQVFGGTWRKAGVKVWHSS
jgi:hypothetical protein